MGQNSRQPLRVAAEIGAGIVGQLAQIRDMACVTLRAITNFGSQRTRFSSC